MFFLNTAYQQERHLQVYGEAHWEILLSKCFKCMIIFYLLNEILINPEKMLKILVGIIYLVRHGFFQALFHTTVFVFQIEFEGLFSAKGSAEHCKPPSRSRAEPWRGTKRQSTEKLSIFGL